VSIPLRVPPLDVSYTPTAPYRGGGLVRRQVADAAASRLVVRSRVDCRRSPPQRVESRKLFPESPPRGVRCRACGLRQLGSYAGSHLAKADNYTQLASSWLCMFAADSCTKPGAAPLPAPWRIPGARGRHAEGQQMEQFCR
jgi:hypothetical protein